VVEDSDMCSRDWDSEPGKFDIVGIAAWGVGDLRNTELVVASSRCWPCEAESRDPVVADTLGRGCLVQYSYDSVTTYPWKILVAAADRFLTKRGRIGGSGRSGADDRLAADFRSLLSATESQH
jgi:hypothetical protein